MKRAGIQSQIQTYFALGIGTIDWLCVWSVASIDAWFALIGAGAGAGVSSFSIARPSVPFISDTMAGTSRWPTVPTSETELVQTVPTVARVTLLAEIAT